MGFKNTTYPNSKIGRVICQCILSHQVLVEHYPRWLSDNGSCYLSKDLKLFLDRKHIEHTRDAPYHPMTQGKIEPYHRSMKTA